jgi:DNA-binding protein
MKAYYLNIKQISCILNYINKTDQVLTSELFDSANNIGDIVNVDRSDKRLICSGLLCLDSLLNTNVYSLTHFQPKEPQIKVFDSISPKAYLTSKPKLKSLVKLIKYLVISFPSYSNEFFMYHLYSKTGISKLLSTQDLMTIKSQLSKKIKSIEIHSFQQNSNITIKNINVNSNSVFSNNRHYKTTSNTRDSSYFNKMLPQTKLNSNSVSGDNSFKSQTKIVKQYIIPSKLNFSNQINNVYVVARDNKIRYKTELDDSESDANVCDNNANDDSLMKITDKGNNNGNYNTPQKRKVIRYYS